MLARRLPLGLVDAVAGAVLACAVMACAVMACAVMGCAVMGCASRPGAPTAAHATSAVGAGSGSSGESDAAAREPAARDAAPRPDPDCTPNVATDPNAAGATGATSEGDDADPEHTLDDGFEAPAIALPSTSPLPFSDLDDAQIAARLGKDIGALGPMSIGQAHGGVLVAGVQMPAGANWEVVSPSLAWGTQETVDALAHAVDTVAARFPDTPKAFIGNISAKRGGYLPPHVSHQSGRDVDVSYYLTEGHRWYATATAANLDRARTWLFVRTLLADSDVDLVLMDVSVQRLLKAYARTIGEDPAWLDQIFQVGGKSARPVIFHAKGHATHLHVRFYSPAAQELGRRAYAILRARHLISPPTVFITHVTKPGETLSHLARRYKVTADAIKKANAMRSDLLRVNKPYKIPQTGGVPMPARLALPARRVPPPVVSDVAGAQPGRVRGWDGAPCRPARAATTPDATRPDG
jgi:LysM repeat protein/murein endopeptidase